MFLQYSDLSFKWQEAHIIALFANLYAVAKDFLQ